MSTAIHHFLIVLILPWAGFSLPQPVPTQPARFPAPAEPGQVSFTGLRWQVEDLGVQGSRPSLTLDADGSPHLGFVGQLPGEQFMDLNYATLAGGGWQYEDVADMPFGGVVQLGLTSSSQPVIAYTPCNPWYCPLFLAQKKAAAWEVQELALSVHPGSVSLDLDSQDRPHLAFCNGTRTIPESVPPELRYIYWSGSEWITATVDTGCSASASLQLDSQDHPRISYYRYQIENGQENGDLHYAGWTGSGWALATVDSAGDVGLYNQLALDSGDRPHIAYRDLTTGSLKYLKWNGQAWEKWTVERSRAFAFDGPISLAIDALDHARIAYPLNLAGDYFQPEFVIRYAAWSGQYWSIGNAGTGLEPDLALDGDGRPVLVYSSYIPNGLSTVQLARGQTIPLEPAVFLPFAAIPLWP